MFRPLCLIFCALVIPYFPAYGEAQKNAADLYRQLPAITRKFTSEEKALLKSLVGRKTPETAESPADFPHKEVANLLDSFSKPLALIAEATQLPLCDWGHDYSSGAPIPTDHLSPLIQLNRLLLLRSRLHLSQGQPEQALQDLQQACALSRQLIDTECGIIELITQSSMSSAWASAASHDLFRWDRAALTSLHVLTPSSGNWEHLPRSIQIEGHQATRSVADGLRSPKPLSIGSFSLPGTSSLQRIPAQLWLKQSAKNLKTQTATILGILNEQPAKGLPKLDKHIQWIEERPLRHLLASLAFSNLGDIARRILREDIALAMLRAAIDIRLKGPQTVENSRDPYDGKPFGYREHDGGFTLTSKLLYKGIPYSLTFLP